MPVQRFPNQTRRTPLSSRLQVWSERRTAGSLRACGSVKVGTMFIFYQPWFKPNVESLVRRSCLHRSCSLCADTDWQDVESNLPELRRRFHGPVPISWRVQPCPSRSWWVSCLQRAVLISHPLTWSSTFSNVHPVESHPIACLLRIGGRSQE